MAQQLKTLNFPVIRDFFGEVGVKRHRPLIKNADGRLDGDYDVTNPDGQAWGRRNYYWSSCYQSGTPALEPEEYRARPDFYRQYRLDEDPSKV